MKTVFISTFVAVLLTLGGRAQEYRGDVPSRYDYQLFREHNRQRAQTDALVQSRERAETVRRYMERAALDQPYLRRIEEAQSGPARDRAIEELRQFVKQTEKTP